uniref:Uncharacterized protein n=1 Tax=Physcomitrium patens TaxID=3218 RepID=A0A2K1JDT6_PHYPA|nr:hypothetical protein PHYPA_019966 [Physcomitrium patens]
MMFICDEHDLWFTKSFEKLLQSLRDQTAYRGPFSAATRQRHHTLVNQSIDLKSSSHLNSSNKHISHITTYQSNSRKAPFATRFWTQHRSDGLPPNENNTSSYRIAMLC